MFWAATGKRKPLLCRLALGSLTALLLLSGCVSAKISPPSLDGGLNSADALQEAADQDLPLRKRELDRESLASVTSRQNTVDLLRRATGQDLYLSAWELGCESLDQYTSFSEETGYGELEQPLEQVDKYRRTYFDGLCYEVFVLDARPTAEAALLLDLPDGTRQELHVWLEPYLVVPWDLRREDLNFDGYPDLALDIGGTRGGRHHADALLWDETEQAYREESSFAQIPTPVLDPEHFIIWGGYDVNWLNYRCAYEIQDGVFTLTHALAAEPIEQANWSAGLCCTEYARLDDNLTEVNHQSFPESDFDYTTALERYLESGPVWSGWLWADMDWHTVDG